MTAFVDDAPPGAGPGAPTQEHDLRQDLLTWEGEGPPLPGLLEEMLLAGASDLHLEVGAEPVLRIDGKLRRMTHAPVLVPEAIRRMVYQVLSEEQRKRFEEERELDISYELVGRGRFRINVLWQRGHVGAAVRAIPSTIPTPEQLGLPPKVSELADLPRGLILVTGPTGSGKSTTIAALIEQINRRRSAMIVTIEDPVEFHHLHRKSVVVQREVGSDTLGFAKALRHALRQDPDVIVIGEMRDPETIATALTAAETGHLVLATLHTSSAKDTVTRIVESFPRNAQEHIRQQLADSLQAVLCQTLCERVDATGRVAALELMLATPAVRAQIREGKTVQLSSTIQGSAKEGMFTLNAHLAQLVRSGRISNETALERVSDRQEYQRRLTMTSPNPRR